MKALNGYRQSANGSRIDKQGIEFQFTSQRISALRTAVVINGAWFRSVYTNSRPMFETVADVVDNRPVSEEYVGRKTGNHTRRNISKFKGFTFHRNPRQIRRIPDIDFDSRPTYIPFLVTTTKQSQHA